MADKASYLANLTQTRAVLDRFGLAAKYALGQNFLVDDNIVRKIIVLSGVGAADDVLEVGPGIGTLTAALLGSAHHVTSVEVDADMPAVLAQTLEPWADRFTLVQKDALDVDAHDLEREGSCPTLFIANLPYAVAATLVLDYFERFGFLQSATVMVQREVAQRMMAQPGTKLYGAYTVKLRLYAQAVDSFTVHPQSFYPAPHVESCVIRLDRVTLAGAQETLLAERTCRCAALMADAAFATRRKTLLNSARTYFAQSDYADRVTPEALVRMFDACDIDARRRGETLSLEEFITLGQALEDMLFE